MGGETTVIKKDLLDAELEKSLTKSVYKQSYYEFFKDAFEVLNPEELYSDNWHIEYICGLLQREAIRIKNRQPRIKDLIINVPFRSSKSLLTSVCFPVWCWSSVLPTFKFIYVSYAEDLALEHAQLSRKLMQSEWFKGIYGDTLQIKQDENSKGFYVNNHGGFRKSVGTGGQITGSGADIIIVDDGQNPKKAASETERKNTKNFWDHTLYSRLNQLELGIRINVQQRLHEEDLTGHLISTNKTRYELIKIPAEITEKTKPIPSSLESYYKNNLFWPQRFTKLVIDDYIATLGSLQAAGQLQQEPAPEEGNLMKRAWFDIVEPETITRDAIREPHMFYIDTADTDDPDNDPYAIACMFRQGNFIYVVDVIEFRKQFHEACKYIIDYLPRMRYSDNSYLKIEPKTAGKSIVSQLRTTTMLNVVELEPPEDDKVTRLTAIQPICESRRVKLIRGNYTESFLNQLCLFPNSKHDDKVDVFVYGVTDLLINSNFDFAFV